MIQRILAIDPSGSFEEGQGTTGWASFYNDELKVPGQIRAEDYSDKQAFWKAHIDLLDILKPELVVMEDFILYAHKSKQQTGSRMETPKLIGVIELECYRRNIPVVLQRAVDVKARWSDDILVHKNIVTKSTGGRYYAAGVLLSEHMRDAIRHGMHFITFKK